MLGSDQTLVDMGIMAFKVRFKSGFQMERLLLFCFICGVLGLGEFVCFKYFGGWTRKSYGFMEVWLGPEHAHLIALSNHTSSNSTFSTLSPTPSSTMHSCDSQGSSVKGKIVIVKMMTLEDDKSETSTKLAEAAAEDAGKKLMT
nr:hypothetical protein CFP56_17145 [Quercus suber]